MVRIVSKKLYSDSYFLNYKPQLLVDKTNPDKFEIIDSMIAVLGVAVIFYAPR
jgi:drug/metabolite transporter superfamily protein YnfA